jgi:hypothetical protein
MHKESIQRAKKKLAFLKSRLRSESGQDAEETRKEIVYYEKGGDEPQEQK